MCVRVCTQGCGTHAGRGNNLLLNNKPLRDALESHQRLLKPLSSAAFSSSFPVAQVLTRECHRVEVSSRVR
jgi:hypothetical protein